MRVLLSSITTLPVKPNVPPPAMEDDLDNDPDLFLVEEAEDKEAEDKE